MERNGRLHSVRRPFYRDYAPRKTRSPSPSTNALQASHAGVLIYFFARTALFRTLISRRSRFYPGLSSPQFKAIEAASSQTAKSIASPVSETQDVNSPPSPSYTGKKATRGHRLARAARVVGSFNHAVLPEPPVSLTYLWITIPSLSDNEPYPNFFIVSARP